MYEVTKFFEFEAGHRLMHHKGKCKNLHGHNYKVEVKVIGDYFLVNESGMLIDFGDLKNIVKPILDNWDHAMIINSHDSELINFLTQEKYNIVTFPGEPTAENMARYLWEKIHPKLDPRATLKIRIWETSTSYAAYYVI